LLVSSNSAQHVGFGHKITYVPDTFSEGTRSDPYLHVVDVLVAELAPKTDLRTENVVPVFIALDHVTDVQVVQVHPGLIVSIGDSEIIADSHIEVEGAVLGNNDGVFGGRKASAPPMHHICGFKLYVVVVHPIHKGLIGVHLVQHLMLFLAIVNFNVALSDALHLDEVCSVLQTGQHHLITTKMHDWVWEDVENLGEDLFYQFICLV
jgi:hypothetical protein